MRRRSLILTSDAARHPFRQWLPRHVLEVKEDAADSASDDNDWKLFLLSFCAFFTAFYSFIY